MLKNSAKMNLLNKDLLKEMKELKILKMKLRAGEN